MQKVLTLSTSTLKNYLVLTKPGIIFGNLITAVAGFALASHKAIDFPLLLTMLFSLSLVIASACIFNNFIDRSLDSKMERTKNRPLVTGVITNQSALIFALALLFLGSFFLYTLVNFPAMLSALLGFTVYVFCYSFSKYQTSLGTLIGSIAGAAPPVVGYVSLAGQFDLAALLIFLVIATWQMPHFYAIAIYRLKDYARGSIPVLPLHKGMQTAKIHMCVYIITFMLASYSLTFFHLTNLLSGIVMALLGLYWLFLGLKGFKASNDTLWARKMFIFSLVIVMVQSALIATCTH